VLPSDDELDAIYGGAYFRDDRHGADARGYAHYLADEAAHRRNARRRLTTLLRGRGGAGSRLLDVGSAAGFFVDEARSFGWDAEGIDLSSDMVDWGRRHLEVDLVAVRFADLERPPGSFAAVTMWDYIEHSADPRGDLQRAHRLLAPGGLLGLSTGDVESAVARLTGSRWHLLTPRHHNYFFGRTTITRMLGETGFDPAVLRHQAGWYSASHLVYKLESLLPGSAGRALSHRLRDSRFGGLEVPVNLYDIVTVLATKPVAA
jgi:SAM-dependent methyltransferase